MSGGGISHGSSRWLIVASVSLIASGGFWSWARVRFDPDRLWDDAQAALQASSPRSAATNLAWIHRLRTPTPRDRLLEAQLAIANGQAERALDALGRIPDRDPVAAQAYLLGGRLERTRNRLHSAEVFFRRALGSDPNLIDAHRELIYVYGIQSRGPEVDAEFRELSRLTILNHHDLFTWAFTKFSPFRPDDAKILRAFVDAEPEDRHSRLTLAEILLSQGGDQGEVESLTAGLPESDADVLATRARAAFSQGHLDVAESLISRGPADHDGLNRMRGKLAVYRHDYDAAIAFYRKSLDHQPYDRMTTLELGQALALKGEKSEAATYLERAKHLSEIYNLLNRIRSAEREGDLSDLIKLARTFELAGLIEEARQWYELAARRDPLDTEVQGGLRRIRGLEKSRTIENEPIGLSANPPGFPSDR